MSQLFGWKNSMRKDNNNNTSKKRWRWKLMVWKPNKTEQKRQHPFKLSQLIVKYKRGESHAQQNAATHFNNYIVHRFFHRLQNFRLVLQTFRFASKLMVFFTYTQKHWLLFSYGRVFILFGFCFLISTCQNPWRWCVQQKCLCECTRTSTLKCRSFIHSRNLKATELYLMTLFEWYNYELSTNISAVLW